MRVLLASASPRRRELLAALGVDFEVVPPAADEADSGAAPEELVLDNARRKALSVVDGAAVGDIVLAVDTDVALDGWLLGKPEDQAGARHRLEALSGRTHEVLSGLAVLLPQPAGANAEERTAVEASQVTFTSLSETTIDRYLASGEWRDRAGAYAVQGLGSMLVERVDGDLSNVIGLPLQRLFALLPELGEKHSF